MSKTIIRKEVQEMKQLDANKVGLIVGGFVGLLHLAWAFVVATGFAQGLLDWVYALHFLSNPFVVNTFSINKAVVLLVITTLVGYIIGWVFTNLWQLAQKK